MQQFRSIGILRCAVWALVVIASSVKAEMPLNGIAVYSRFGQEQFMAGLYVQKLTTSDAELLQASSPGLMELRIIDDRIFPRRFQRMWVEGIAINARDQELENFAPLMADFNNMLNLQLRRGDVFRIERTPTNRVVIQLNDSTLGELDDPLFFNLLLRTWIGPVPLSSDFKAALLTAGNIATAPFQRYLALTPAEERKNQVATALQERRSGASASVPPVTPPVAAAVAPATGSIKPELPTAPKAPEADSVAAGTAGQTAERPKDPATIPGARTATDPIPAQSPDSDSLALNDVGNDSVLLTNETEVTATAATILIEQRYINSLIRRTQSFAKYPRASIKRNHEGVMRLTATLSATGNVVNIEYDEKSNHEALNRAAREAIESADPFPPIPPELLESQFQFSVPIVFRLL